MKQAGKIAPQQNLLFQFYAFNIRLDKGVRFNDNENGYLYDLFCPELAKYGFFEKRYEATGDLIYYISADGVKFHNLLEKRLSLKKDKFFKDFQEREYKGDKKGNKKA